MKRAQIFSITVFLLFTLSLGACASSSAAKTRVPPPPRAHLTAGQHIQTVFLIVMENHNWSSIKGNPSAPYINKHLLPQASYATQYYNPPGNHPSLPNYLWLEAGTNCFPDIGCVRDDLGPGSHSTSSHQHLAALLQRAHVSWRAYEENINGTTCPIRTSTVGQVAAENGVPGLGGYLYAPRHDPFVYFKDITANLSPTSRDCITHIRPFTELGADLRSNHVARYNFITPNVCDDMHSPCPVLSNQIKQGDTWLSRVIPAIQKSKAYRAGGTIFIVWDEGEGGDGPIGCIVLSPDAKGHGYHNALHYTHSSMVRTMEEIFHVRPFLGGAADAPDLRDLFRHFP
jgi:hypothetical protein